MPRILYDSMPIICTHFSTLGVVGISSSFRSELKCQLPGAALSGLVMDILHVLPCLHFLCLCTLSSTVFITLCHFLCVCVTVYSTLGRELCGMSSSKADYEDWKGQSERATYKSQLFHFLTVRHGASQVIFLLHLDFYICNIGIIYLVPTP